MKHHHFAAFLALIGSYIALHFYSAAWLARIFALSPGAARTARILLLLLAFFSPFTMFLRHRYAGPVLEPVYLAGYYWMGIILLAGSTFLLSDLLGQCLRRLLSPEGLRWFRFGTAAFLGGVIAVSIYNGRKAPALKELRLSVPGLPAAMEGLKIAQISDIHIDSRLKLKRFSAVVKTVKAQKPDLVLFTGDLLDPGLTCGPELAGLVRELKPRLGIFGVLGNHEYYFGYEKSLACYKECGITLLRNESYDAAGFRVIGLSDIMTESMTGQAVAAILRKNNTSGFQILMSHQPLMLDLMAENGSFIGFSGHTHGGQIFPFHLFTRMAYKYFYGLYHIKNSFFYVTSGAGTWGPPMRLLAAAEIPLVTLSGR
jgi:predicted MPP superfamily phosphohydrolase